MYPVLFKIPVFGGITIYSYGVMVALGFVAGIIWINYESRRLGADTAKAMDLLFYIIIAGIFGSRILDVIVSEREQFLANPIMIFKVWEGGLVYYGGVVAAVLVTIWFVRRHKMSFLLTVDIFAPALALGHAVGRLGCFLAGCCYGRPLEHETWYSVVFPAIQKTFAPVGVPLYPTQLMESAGEFFIFLCLVALRKFKRFDGQIFATYLMLYACLRVVLELFRGDLIRGFVIDNVLSTSQFISILLFTVGLLFYIRLWRKNN